MSTYAHFDTAIPTGVEGLAVGSRGSEVTVADSSGNLYQAGTVITATAAELNYLDGAGAYPVSGTAAAKVINAGSVAMDDLSATIDTGLTTISQAVVSRRMSTKAMASFNNSLDAIAFSAYFSGGNLWIRSYRLSHALGAGSPAPTCNTSTKVCSVDWIVFGA